MSKRRAAKARSTQCRLRRSQMPTERLQQSTQPVEPANRMPCRSHHPTRQQRRQAQCLRRMHALARSNRGRCRRAATQCLPKPLHGGKRLSGNRRFRQFRGDRRIRRGRLRRRRRPRPCCRRCGAFSGCGQRRCRFHRIRLGSFQCGTRCDRCRRRKRPVSALARGVVSMIGEEEGRERHAVPGGFGVCIGDARRHAGRYGAIDCRRRMRRVLVVGIDGCRVARREVVNRLGPGLREGGMGRFRSRHIGR